MKERLRVNPFWLMAALYLTAGLVFALWRGLSDVPGTSAPSNVNWLRVHTVTIGTVVQMVFATLPGLAARKYAMAQRTTAETWLQWGLVNGGFLLIVAGIVGVDNWSATAGATLIFAAVWRLWTGLVGAWRKAGRPWRDSFRFYATAPLFFLTGITMAVTLLFNWFGPGGRAGTFEAHVHANVWGFAAMLVAGVLFDLFPAVTGVPVARPAWIRPIYWLLTAGAAGLVAGPWVGWLPATVGGLLLYMAGTAQLVALLLLTLMQRRRTTASALHLVTAYTWMIVPAIFAPFIVLAPHLVRAAAIETAATQGLINGWLVGVIMGALPVILYSRTGETDLPLFAPDPSGSGRLWPVGLLNTGVALIWATVLTYNQTLATSLTVAGYSLIGVAWIPLLRSVWRHATAAA